MSKPAVISGEIKTRRQRRREQRRRQWPVVLALSVVALLLISLQAPLAGAVGCALVDFLSPVILSWRS